MRFPTIIMLSLLAIGLGFLVRMKAEDWAMAIVVNKDSSRAGYIDNSKQQAYEQLSNCLSYGGTAVWVISLSLLAAQLPIQSRR